MIDELVDYDTVRIYFDDGTDTVIHVHQDDDIPAAIADLCDTEGWDTESVINYAIVEQ